MTKAKSILFVVRSPEYVKHIRMWLDSGRRREHCYILFEIIRSGDPMQIEALRNLDEIVERRPNITVIREALPVPKKRKLLIHCGHAGYLRKAVRRLKGTLLGRQFRHRNREIFQSKNVLDIAFWRLFGLYERRFALKLSREILATVDGLPELSSFDKVVFIPYVFYGSCQQHLNLAAQRAGVATVAHIGSWDNLTTKTIVKFPADEFVMWNEAQIDELRRYQFIKAKSAATGSMSMLEFVERAEKFDVEPSADRLNVLFLGSSLGASPDERMILEETIYYLYEYSCQTETPVALIIRPHPRVKVDPLMADGNNRFTVTLDSEHEGGEEGKAGAAAFISSLKSADVVVAVNSSAIYQALLLGRKVLIPMIEGMTSHESVYHFKHLREMMDEGTILSFSDLESLKAALSEAPDDAGPRLDEFLFGGRSDPVSAYADIMERG